MRISIELSDAEAHATTISPTLADLGRGGASAGPAEAHDGGAPAEALLVALGADAASDAMPDHDSGPSDAAHGRATDAGAPPTWLMGVVTGGADHTD